MKGLHFDPNVTEGVNLTIMMPAQSIRTNILVKIPYKAIYHLKGNVSISLIPEGEEKLQETFEAGGTTHNCCTGELSFSVKIPRDATSMTMTLVSVSVDRISVAYEKDEKNNPRCYHEWVDVGFMSKKMACKYCGEYKK